MASPWRFGTMAMLVGRAMTQAGFAGNGSWNVDGSGNWSDAGNWSNPGFPNAVADVATFGNGPGTANLARTVTLATPVTIGVLDFSATAAVAYNITGDTLQFDNSPFGPGIVMQGAVGADQTISAGVSILASQTLTIDQAAASRTLTFSGGLTASGTSMFVVTGDGTVAFSGPGIGAGISTVSKPTGSGTLIFSSANTHAGSTLIGAGTLLVTATGTTGTGATTLSGPGTALAGSGTINTGLDMQGGTALTPGTVGTPGALTVAGNTALSNTTTLVVDIASAGSFDQLVGTAGLGLGTILGSSFLDVQLGFAPTVGTIFEIVDMQGTGFIESGSLFRLPDTTQLDNNDIFTVASTDLRINYDYGAGGGVTLSVVPEPTTLGLLAAGGGRWPWWHGCGEGNSVRSLGCQPYGAAASLPSGWAVRIRPRVRVVRG